jgi:hypothetical protein
VAVGHEEPEVIPVRAGEQRPATLLERHHRAGLGAGLVGLARRHSGRLDLPVTGSGGQAVAVQADIVVPPPVPLRCCHVTDARCDHRQFLPASLSAV